MCLGHTGWFRGLRLHHQGDVCAAHMTKIISPRRSLSPSPPVREHLLYAARLRLPRTMTRAQKTNRVVNAGGSTHAHAMVFMDDDPFHNDCTITCDIPMAYMKSSAPSVTRRTDGACRRRSSSFCASSNARTRLWAGPWLEAYR